jgi:signal transduction histidine kinase
LAELSPELGAAFQQVLSSGDNIHTELSLIGPPRLDLAVHIAYMQILSEQEDWWTIVLHDITLLKDYDRLKTQFVANASHELRTPLANIKLYARLANRTAPKKRRSIGIRSSVKPAAWKPWLKIY